MPARSSILIAPIVILVAAVTVAGCGVVDDAAGQSAAAASPAGSVVDASVPTTPHANLPHGILDPPPPTACLTLGPADCARARDIAAESLDTPDPAVVYAQVGPFGCAVGERCAFDLTARPEGDVVLEFADGTAINVHVIQAPDGSGGIEREAASGVVLAPTSSPVEGPGPFPFSLGHCGIFSGIDLDGSWWDPVGPIPLESGAAVNATDGTVVLTDPTHGVFRAPDGFVIQLQRHDGPKSLPFCM